MAGKLKFQDFDNFGDEDSYNSEAFEKSLGLPLQTTIADQSKDLSINSIEKQKEILKSSYNPSLDSICQQVAEKASIATRQEQKLDMTHFDGQCEKYKFNMKSALDVLTTSDDFNRIAQGTVKLDNAQDEFDKILDDVYQKFA